MTTATDRALFLLTFDRCNMPTGRGLCMFDGSHRDSCLPPPPRVPLCVPCDGRGNSDWTRDFSCGHCGGTGLAL